jgi:hypothetical protein
LLEVRRLCAGLPPRAKGKSGIKRYGVTGLRAVQIPAFLIRFRPGRPAKEDRARTNDAALRILLEDVFVLNPTDQPVSPVLHAIYCFSTVEKFKLFSCSTVAVTLPTKRFGLAAASSFFNSLLMALDPPSPSWPHKQ